MRSVAASPLGLDLALASHGYLFASACALEICGGSSLRAAEVVKFVDVHATGFGRLEMSEMSACTLEAVEVGDVDVRPSACPYTLGGKGKSI